MDAPVLFQAIITPHRSLSPRGLRILVAVICLCSGLTLLRLLLLQAWLVVGFSVLEVGLAVALLGLNARRARASELLLLTEEVLTVVRTDAAGRRKERRLSPAWLNVVLEERPGQVPRLLLAARNGHEEVGSWLGEEEKRNLAAALREALHRMRNPVFDNPQLRDWC